MKKLVFSILTLILCVCIFAQSQEKLGITDKDCKNFVKNNVNIATELDGITGATKADYAKGVAICNKYGISGEKADKKIAVLLLGSSYFIAKQEYEKLQKESPELLEAMKDKGFDPEAEFKLEKAKLATIHPDDLAVVERNIKMFKKLRTSKKIRK